MHARETFDAAQVAESPMVTAACDAYAPDSQVVFNRNQKPGGSEKMNDEALNSFFKNNMDCDSIYRPNQTTPEAPKTDCADTKPAPAPEAPHYQRHIQEGIKDLGDSEREIRSALRRLDRGDVGGATRDIKEAREENQEGREELRKGLREHKGDGETGKYGEDAIKDGIKETKQSNTELGKALNLLKNGKTSEAKEALQEALRSLRSGKDEVKDGGEHLDGKPSLECADERKEVVKTEFGRGGQHLDRSATSLDDALKSLNCNNGDGAIRDLLRSKRELNNGKNDYNDGLRVHEGKDGEKPIRQGLDKADNNNWAIDTAIDLIKRGCPAAAKDVIQGSINRLRDARQTIDNGVENLDKPSCPVEPVEPPCPQPEPPDCPEQPPQPENPQPQPEQPPHCPEQPHNPEPQPEPNPQPPRPDQPTPNPDRPEPQPPQCPERRPRPEPREPQLPRDGSPDCGNDDRTEPRPDDRVEICPCEGQERPPMQPGEFIVVMINVSRDQLGDLLGRLFGNRRGAGDGGVGLPASPGSNGSSGGGFNFFDPLGLADNLPQPGDLVSNLPNPLDPFNFSNGRTPNPLDPMSMLNKAPDLLDPSKAIDMLPVPKPVTNILKKPLDIAKSIFKKIF